MYVCFKKIGIFGFGRQSKNLYQRFPNHSGVYYCTMLDNSIKDSFDLIQYHKEHYLEKKLPNYVSSSPHQIILALRQNVS